MEHFILFPTTLKNNRRFQQSKISNEKASEPT